MSSDIKIKVRERIAAEEANKEAPAKPKPVRRELSNFEIMTCAWESHAGDAVVYIYVNFGRFCITNGEMPSTSGPATIGKRILKQPMPWLRWKRLVYASEPDDGRKFSAGKVKWLTGREKLVARVPHDISMSYWYSTHFLILMTNSLPQALADDQAF